MKFSYAKARTCIHLQSSSRTFREKYTGEGEAPKFTQAAAMCTLMKDELVPVAGGVPIKGAGMFGQIQCIPNTVVAISIYFCYISYLNGLMA